MTEIWNLNTLCRCCHADGSFSNLNSPCDVMGSNELCSVLLKDIFGIQLHSPSIEVSHMICDKCIKRLQDGAMFKKQVMECELKFQEYCKNELLQNMNIKLEQDEEDTSFVVKTETDMEYEDGATKLKRSENWSAEEKDILREMIAHSRHIIEDKSSKASTNIKKAQEWKNIEKKINELMGKNWSAGDVKLAWKRMKLEAKANLSARRQYQMKKGGGEKPKSPSQDLAIMNIDPHDFVEEYTDCDSDAEKTVVELKPPEDSVTTAGPSTGFSPIIREPSSSTTAGPSTGFSPIIREPSSSTTAGPSTGISPIIREPPPEFKDEVEKVMMDQGTSKVNVLTTGTSTPRKKENINRKQSDEKVPKRIKEAMLNIELKKKQIHMLQVEHQYFNRIAELKIKLLELEREKIIRLKEL